MQLDTAQKPGGWESCGSCWPMARSRAVSKPSLGSEHSRGVGPSLEGPLATCWSGLGSSGLRLGQHDDVSHLWASGSVGVWEEIMIPISQELSEVSREKKSP